MLVGLCARARTWPQTTIPNKQPKAMGPTQLSLGKATHSRAVNPTGSRVTVATASLQTLRAMARAATVVLTDRPRIQATARSQLPRDMAQLVAMAVARVLSRLTGNSLRTLAMASSQLLAAPQEVTVAVLKAAAMGSPRVEAMASSLAMVGSSKAMGSSRAITRLRATGSRTSTAVVVAAAEGVAEVAMAKISPP